jgi:hypothetical protein
MAPPYAEFLSDDRLIILGAVVLDLLIFVGGFWGGIRILRRMGLSGWWIFMIFLWPIGLLMLAYSRWPAFEKKLVPGTTPNA